MLEARSLKTSCCQDHTASKGFKDECVSCLFQFLVAAPGILWLVVTLLHLCLNGHIPSPFLSLSYKNTYDWGLPWWRSGWESGCQCKGHRFEPWSGKIPHVAEQQGPWATTTEPARLETVLRNKRGRDSERPVKRDEEWPPLAATRENPHTETKTQHTKNK